MEDKADKQQLKPRDAEKSQPPQLAKIAEMAASKAIEKMGSLMLNKFPDTAKRNQSVNKTVYQRTEQRLYSYPSLLKNIKELRLDIEDLKREGITQTSKDIVRYSIAGSISKTPEEVQEELILAKQRRLWWDEQEVKEIERAIARVKADDYFEIIKFRYFEEKDDEEIAKLIPCSERNVRRHKSRLVNKIAVYFYGASPVQIG